MIDNQWPQKKENNLKKKTINKNQIYKIEKFFKVKYKSKFAVLMPSARASITLYLRFNKIGRSETVSIPKGSSSCLYTSIGSFSNISIADPKADVILINHKWGNQYFLKNRLKKIKHKIIEDSVDSLPSEEFIPFQNGGIIEIISLPKIIGCISGGIILTNSRKLFNYAKKMQNKNKKLGDLQYKRKMKDIHYTTIQNLS